MQDGRQGLIDDHAEHGVQQTLDQREGQVEDDEALYEAVGRGQDGLIHAEDGFQRHMVELHIGRVGDEVVGGYAEQGHGGGTRCRAEDGGLAALMMLVDEARHSGEDSAQHKVAQLADTGSAGTLDDDVEQVLHEADDHAVHRAEGERAQQGGQVGEVHLDEGRDEHRNGELDEHQDERHCAEHGGNGQVVGRIFSHNFPPGAGGPIQIKTGKPFSRSLEPGRQMKTRPAIAYTITGRAQTNQIACRFLHPDYTVGPGVSPGQHSFGSGRGLYRQWGIAPRPETNFLRRV